MSPHVVDCAVGALEVGVTAGVGGRAAKVNVKNRGWYWRRKARRIPMMATENDWDKERRTRKWRRRRGQSCQKRGNRGLQ